MSATRVFVDPAALRKGEVHITDPTAVHHLVRVLRVRPGDEIVAVVPGDGEYPAVVTRVLEDAVKARAGERRVPQVEPRVEVHLYQALPKADRMELVIQKATEIGVHRVIPVRTLRTVVDIPAGRQARRLARWRSIAREAARQSGRLAIPAVEAPLPLQEALATAPGLRLMAAVGEGSLRLSEALPADASCVSLFIGPEGGFSEAERRMAVDLEAKLVSLGPRVLRTETAGLVALTLVLGLLGDL